MHEKRIEDELPVDRVSDEDRDRCVLNMMLCDSPWPWTVGEIARALNDQIGAEDSVARLVAAGLAHRLREFVMPTLAARRADQIGVGYA